MNGGFHNSPLRVVLEIAVVLAGLAILVLFGVWLAARAAALALPFVPESVDRVVGEASFAAVTSTTTLCTSDEPRLYVEKLAAPLVAAMGSEAPQFTFAVIDDPSANAFALPGGFVVVHMGLIDLADSGDEIAGVLAHELAHVTHRHGMQRVLRSAGASVLFGLILGSSDLGALARHAEDLTHRAYDRDQEREADAAGRATLSAARVPADGLARLFARMSERHGDTAGVWTFLSSHPALAERVRAASEAPVLEGPPLQLPSPEGLRCHVEAK